MIPSKIAACTFAIAFGLVNCTSAFAQGLSASGAGEVEVAPKDTPKVGGDVLAGDDDRARTNSQADVERKDAGSSSETNSGGAESQ